MERLPLEDGYINSHLSSLGDDCAAAIIAADLEEHIDALSFTPNEFYEDLDLLELAFPEDGIDWALILMWIGGVLLCGAVILLAIVIIRRIRKKRRQKIKALMKK